MSYSQEQVDRCNGIGADWTGTPKQNRSLYLGGNWVPCSTIRANPPQAAPQQMYTLPVVLPAPQQPDTQPIVPISASPAPAAGIVQPTQSLNLTDPTIIIAAILVILLGFMLSRR